MHQPPLLTWIEPSGHQHPPRKLRNTASPLRNYHEVTCSRPRARTIPTRHPNPTAPSTAPILSKTAANMISGCSTSDTKQITTEDSRHRSRGNLCVCRAAPTSAAPNARANVRVIIYATAGRRLPCVKSTITTTLIITKNKRAPTHRINPALQ